MLVYPAVLAAIAAVAIIFVARSARARRLVLRFEDPGRIRLLSMAILAWTAGIIFFDALTFDDNDNAYLGLGVLGLLMVPAGLAFLVEAVLPGGPIRRWAAFVTVVAFVVVGLLGFALLAWALVIIPGEDYDGNDVLVAHLLGLCLMGGLLVAAFILFRPARAS